MICCWLIQIREQGIAGFGKYKHIKKVVEFLIMHFSETGYSSPESKRTSFQTRT